MAMKIPTKLIQEKFEMVQRWESSGMVQIEFCKKEGIVPHHFYHWLNKYRAEKKKSSPAGEFIKLSAPVKPTPVVKSTSGSIYAEMVFKNGAIIRFHERVEVADLKQLAGL
jgi:transposase-like protein